MVSRVKPPLILLFLLTLGMSLAIIPTFALTIHVANSKNWMDVYAVMLHASMQDEKGLFLNSENLNSLTRRLPKNADIIIYTNPRESFIPNLRSQLESAGYTVIREEKNTDFITSLAPDTPRVAFIISADNPRISIPLIPLAQAEEGWVFILTPTNAMQAREKLARADHVIAYTPIRRDVKRIIQDTVDEWRDGRSAYDVSISIAQQLSLEHGVTLSDGRSLEEEYFYAHKPVIITGTNRVDPHLFSFLINQHVKIVTVVGNQLAVVGEEIRRQSNRTISVFIKFGQSDVSASGRIYALTMFPLPQPQPALRVTRAAYDPQAKLLAVTYQNPGNVGVYELTTAVVKRGEKEYARIADENVTFIGAGETLTKTYPVDLPAEALQEGTIVEFYTSYGITPTDLDTFLTMRNRFGPPFSINLTITNIKPLTGKVIVLDAAYYPSVKRFGIRIQNNASTRLAYALHLKNIIINGIPTDLSKKGYLKPGEQTVYIPARLDPVDREENTNITGQLYYGETPDDLYTTLTFAYPYKEASSGLTGFITSSPAGMASMVVLILIIAIILVITLKRSRTRPPRATSSMQPARPPSTPPSTPPVSPPSTP